MITDQFSPMNTPQILLNGLIGICGSTFAVVSTFQEQLDWSVRFTGSCIGLAIGLISLYRAFSRKSNKP
jgi:hypothetical protein